MIMDKPLYYEAHVTIEPVFDDKLDKFIAICKTHKFYVATLLMQKRKEDTEERSKYDSFCTSHGQDHNELKQRMFSLLDDLKESFQVWRYKIEIISLDSRYNDGEYPLDKSKCPEKERNPRPLVEKPASVKACEHRWVMDGHNAGDPICSKCYARE